MREPGNEVITDQRALVLICEFAKTDDEAFKLMVNLEKSKEYGESDMLLNKIHYYIREKIK